MKYEIEIITNEILPAIRSLITEELREEYGHNQNEIALKLGLTQPAVSNYLNNSRANQELLTKMRNDPQIMVLIKDASSKAAKDQTYTDDVDSIIRNIRDKGLLKEKFTEAEKLI